MRHLSVLVSAGVLFILISMNQVLCESTTSIMTTTTTATTTTTKAPAQVNTNGDPTLNTCKLSSGSKHEQDMLDNLKVLYGTQ